MFHHNVQRKNLYLNMTTKIFLLIVSIVHAILLFDILRVGLFLNAKKSEFSLKKKKDRLAEKF